MGQNTLGYLKDFKQKDRETGDTLLGYLKYGICLGLRPQTTLAVTTTHVNTHTRAFKNLELFLGLGHCVKRILCLCYEQHKYN